MNPIRPLRISAALIAACLALALVPIALAQTRSPAASRLNRPPAADSIVRAIFAAGSAGVTPVPVVSAEVPRYWQTRAERTAYKQSADYDETMRYCRQLEAGSRWVKLDSYGKSGQGRDLPLLIISKDRAFTPEAARALGKPVVLIQNGIHAGEIEGKDASLALARDMAVLRSKADLLDSCTVLILPIFSVDAHERRSRYNRMNQNGPDEMGWRHTPLGLNLNRDYVKAESPEMRALLSNVYSKWWPELLIDNHTTDGSDYRHDVTYSYPHGPNCPPSIEQWFNEAFEGRVVPRLTELGHLPAPYLLFRKGAMPTRGIDFATTLPRYSTGYAPQQSRAALLVETHMLKPYGSRVKATYDLLVAVLEELRARPRALTQAVATAEAQAIARANERDPAKRTLVLTTRTDTTKSVPFAFKGVVTRWQESEITGNAVPRYTNAPWDTVIALYREQLPVLSVTLPAGYLIPQEWASAITKFDTHGIQYRRLAKALRDTVEMVRITEWSPSAETFEGHRLVSVAKVRGERQVRSFRAGDVWLPLAQRSSALIAALCEAQSPDGLLAWNTFDTIFQRKENGENYVMEPVARQMMANDPKLAEEFRTKVASDSVFARNPAARIDWFYRRSLWADSEQDLMPIARALHVVPENMLVPLPGAAPVIDAPSEKPRR